MKIRKFNEGMGRFDYESISFFDVIVEKLKAYDGYTVFHISKEEQYCQIFNFKTKEEFDKEFSIKKHPIYPGNMIIPNNISEKDRDFDMAIIGNQEFYLDPTSLYLVAEGKLIR